MMKHYNVKLSRDYVISCIDNYVEMYRIHPGKKILVHKNKFQLVDDETFNSDSNNDNDSNEHADDDVDVDSDTDTDNDNHSNENENENNTDNENNKEPRLVIHTNLEESHEMCDIEILDYD
jgi:hypothetical protein